MSFKRYINKKNDSSFPKMVDFFSNIVSINTKTWKNNNPYSPIKYDFDIFYLCMILGIKFNLLEDDSKYTSEVFYNQENFPKEYKSKENTIVPIILYQISKNENYNLNNKKSTRELINNFIVPSTLSKDLIKYMNEYSLGGYIKILESFNFETPDTDLSKFFNKYNKLMSS